MFDTQNYMNWLSQEGRIINKWRMNSKRIIIMFHILQLVLEFNIYIFYFATKLWLAGYHLKRQYASNIIFIKSSLECSTPALFCVTIYNNDILNFRWYNCMCVYHKFFFNCHLILESTWRLFYVWHSILYTNVFRSCKILI